MFCSSKLKTTPRGGESPPSRDDKAPPTVPSGDVDQPFKDNYDSDVLDASEKGIEPGGVAVIAFRPR